METRRLLDAGAALALPVRELRSRIHAEYASTFAARSSSIPVPKGRGLDFQRLVLAPPAKERRQTAFMKGFESISVKVWKHRAASSTNCPPPMITR